MATTAVLESLRQHHEAAQPALQELVDIVVKTLRSNILRAGISAVFVSGRVKETASLVKKAIRKDYRDPWSEIMDKAGARVTAVFEKDLPIIEQVVRDHFTVTHYENKLNNRDPTVFDYLGLHFEVTLLPSIEPHLEQRSCEIQVRTSVQTAWADVSHDLFYKAPVVIGIDTKRSLHRLMALVELFDLEVARIRKEIVEAPGFVTGQLILALEQEFLAMTGHAFDPELSRQVVDSLLPIIPSTTTHQMAIKAFVQQHRNKLEAIYEDYLLDDRHPLMSQPESLLIFERIETDRFALQEHWPTTLPMSFLETMAAIWGKPLEFPVDA